MEMVRKALQQVMLQLEVDHVRPMKRVTLRLIVLARWE